MAIGQLRQFQRQKNSNNITTPIRLLTFNLTCFELLRHKEIKGTKKKSSGNLSPVSSQTLHEKLTLPGGILCEMIVSFMQMLFFKNGCFISSYYDIVLLLHSVFCLVFSSLEVSGNKCSQ